MENSEIRLLLGKNLNKERYEHSIRVAETAKILALRFGLDSNKAYVAGLLHDCAKGIDTQALLQVAEKIGIKTNEIQREKPLKFLHAQVSAFMAKELYNVSDKEVLQAIKFHHEGSIDMTSFDKIIALSDMIEPNRNFSDVSQLRNILETSIDEAYFYAYKNIITNYIQLNLFLEDSRITVYNHLLFQKLHK